MGNKRIFIYIAIAFLFSIALRMFWVYHFQDTEAFKWNNQLMINTNDGYFWAEGARDILAGFHQKYDLSPISTPTSIVTAFFAKILPFSFETIILYLPAFLSSLIVIPLVLMGKSLKNIYIGFFAALFGSIAWSYYNRTMVGYCDTDMLNIVLPTFILWSLIEFFSSNNKKYMILPPIFMMIYSWWYGASYSLNFAFSGIVFLYFLYQLFKKQSYHDTLFLFMLMTLALTGVELYIKFILVIITYILFIKFSQKLKNTHIYILLTVVLLIFFLTGGFSPIWYQLKGYIIRESVVDNSSLNLHFYSVLKTVREAGKIPFETFANRISGHTVTLVLSVVGYIWLVFKKPLFLLSLPMVGLGFLALKGGLRFTVYAIPPLAIGLGFLFYQVSQQLSKMFIDDRVSKLSKYVIFTILSFLAIYPNIIHIKQYLVPTVFVKDEVKVLDKLKHIAKREDYVISWWDYGYPIRYYSDVKTLVDGGKHTGDVNFPVSFILTNPQESSANMARLDVEYTQKAYEENNKTNHIEMMMRVIGYKDVSKFIDDIKDIKLPKKTRDIYLYLPNRMLNIFSTVDLFSNIDLQTGNKKYNTLYMISKNFRENASFLELGNGVVMDKKKAILKIGANPIPINSIYITEYDKSGKLHVTHQNLYPNSQIYMIVMKNYHQILVMDNRIFNSTFIQMFVLENYDKDLYESVILSPLAKIYKLKR